MIQPIVVGCDFDGTIAEKNYSGIVDTLPEIGKQIGRCLEIITELRAGYPILFVLCTVRSGEVLRDAMSWLWYRNCFMDGYNTQTNLNFIDSTKLMCDYFIDDHNVDWVMAGNTDITPERWEEIREFLIQKAEERLLEYSSQGQSDNNH